MSAPALVGVYSAPERATASRDCSRPALAGGVGRSP